MQLLHGAMAYRAQRQIITFVANYFVPQQNPVGRLLPRYDLRNPVYFVERLNRVIANEITGLPNVYLLDLDQISATFGRKYSQDDVIWPVNHGSLASDYDFDLDSHRIETPVPLSAQLAMRRDELAIAVCREIRALYRTLHQADQVKIVIVDLDDTMWRGVIAEDGPDRPGLLAGWPMGFAEALMYLKKRGVLLAIVSKNDEERIRSLWPDIFQSRLQLDDFASIKINWEPKADNVERVLKEVNLLPRNAVFIDDNPVERENVAVSFPGLRVLGSSPYMLRRVYMGSRDAGSVRR